ncbi:MAG: MarR family transcriptional regulator [Candidatus Hodarchaeota archaeon]
MTQPKSQDFDSTQLWQFIPINQYTRPTKPLEETVRLGIKGIFQKLMPTKESIDLPLNQKELTVIPLMKLDRIVPSPDWTDALNALNLALEEWEKSGSSKGNIVFIVCHPFEGTQEILSIWGKERGWVIIDPPRREEILDRDLNWFISQIKDGDASFILPNLEHCYLRHVKGLSFLRELFDWLWSNSCQCVIGIDSWAWSYLNYVLKIDTYARMILVLKALDYDRLNIWFNLLFKQSIKRNLIFRETTTGKYVLSPTDPVKDDKIAARYDKKFLKNLAGYSLGIPLVTWRIWRISLRTDPDEELLLKEDELEMDPRDKRRTIWVLPWEKVELPIIPEGVKRNESHILHALLLHNGLPIESLSQIVPISVEEVMQNLNKLKRLGLIENREEDWIVSPIAYPRIREFLNSEGYLIDDL